MDQSGAATVESRDPADAPARRTNAKSGIKFPYADLEVASGVAKKIHEKGGTRGETVQVAAWLGHETVDSGAFRLRTSAAQTFGLIAVKPGLIELTELGRRIVDPKTEAIARVDAFLAVPLYSRLYETFKTGLLPGDAGLENEIQRLGVPPKQTDTARQIFARSAKQSGFFDEGPMRLVKPVRKDAGGSTAEVLEPSAESDPGEQYEMPRAGEEKRIQLRGGGSLTLIASVQFLRMPREDRDFVFELIDSLDGYANRRLIAERASGADVVPEPPGGAVHEA